MDKIIVDQVKVDEIVIEAIRSQVADKMNYNRALLTMVERSMENNADAIQAILDDTLKSVIANPNFKKSVKEEFERKVAKTLVGYLEGAVGKAANVYRQNPTLKSKLILAIENIINSENPEAKVEA